MKMTDKKEAISITESFIRENEVYNSFVVDSANIIEREAVWYVPFKELNPNPDNILVGAYNGLIVDKNSNEFMQPGSALDLETWMYGFKIGLRGGRQDLLIEKINDYRATLEVLDKLGLTYVKIKLEGKTEWKIPKDFKRKEIKKRLDKLPCIFKNQAFTFSIDEFKQIRNERMFEYKLLKSENTDQNILGELI
ncbi:hypothetical protein [Tenacibaculum xiamenense]|uniref:hypothetical protein n=1 Tax=Tenacibaculum xiamenense TaxID=1261553 RepID=UPI003893F525